MYSILTTKKICEMRLPLRFFGTMFNTFMKTPHEKQTAQVFKIVLSRWTSVERLHSIVKETDAFKNINMYET